MINLMPWRELKRQRQLKWILAILLLVMVLQLLGCWLIRREIVDQSELIIADNQLVLAETKKVRRDTKAIVKQQKYLLTRKIIEKFEAIDRLNLAKLAAMATLNKLLPGGVYVKQLEIDSDVLRLRGSANSKREISQLVKALQQQSIFSDINLKQLQHGLRLESKTEFMITMELAHETKNI